MGRFGAKRPQQTRDTLPIVLIVCDDSKTAPAYFEEVRAQAKGKCTIRVIAAPRHGATGSDVIECAVNQKRQLSEQSGASVWAAVDLEMAHDSKTLEEALRKKAKKHGVELTISQPCFEVWVLAHFIDSGRQFDSCDAVLHEVKKRWETDFGHTFPQKKAQADYQKLMDKIKTAVNHAKPRGALNSGSWTEVWRIAERIMTHLEN